jgi:type II secretion system protein I
MKTNFSNRARRAFTLLEVMIAAAMFFLAVFAILGLVSQTLNNACRLQRPQVDASAVLALFVSTNQLVEGTYSGNLSDSLGDAYRDYNWTAEITEVATNKLFSIECIVQANGKQEIVSDMTTLFYRPKSVAGSMDGGNFIHK